MTSIVSARDANQRFSEILAQVAEGETVIITRRGEPVAELSPYRSKAMSPERKAAWDRLLARLEKGVPAPPGGWAWNRDDLYSRAEMSGVGTFHADPQVEKA